MVATVPTDVLDTKGGIVSEFVASGGGATTTDYHRIISPATLKLRLQAIHDL